MRPLADPRSRASWRQAQSNSEGRGERGPSTKSALPQGPAEATGARPGGTEEQVLCREGGGPPRPGHLPVPSSPYSERFCSSSSCCLLCLHTEHLRQRRRRVGDARTAGRQPLRRGGSAHSGPVSPSRAAGARPRTLHLQIFRLRVNLSSQNQIRSQKLHRQQHILLGNLWTFQRARRIPCGSCVGSGEG